MSHRIPLVESVLCEAESGALRLRKDRVPLLATVKIILYLLRLLRISYYNTSPYAIILVGFTRCIIVSVSAICTIVFYSTARMYILVY
jgi:hypothetical protein